MTSPAPARGRPGVRSGRRAECGLISLPRQPRRADTQSRHADADTQTRASNEARNDGPLRQRARELRHRVLGAVHAVVLDSTARPRLLDLQLPRRDLLRRFQGRSSWRSSWIQFVSVQASSGEFRWFVLEKPKRVWSCTNTWRHVALPAAGRLRVSSSSVSARRLFLGPRHPKPALATPHATPRHAAPRRATPRQEQRQRVTSTGRALDHRA